MSHSPQGRFIRAVPVDSKLNVAVNSGQRLHIPESETWLPLLTQLHIGRSYGTHPKG